MTDWQPLETAPKNGMPMLWFGRWKPFDILKGGEPAMIIGVLIEWQPTETAPIPLIP